MSSNTSKLEHSDSPKIISIRFDSRQKIDPNRFVRFDLPIHMAVSGVPRILEWEGSMCRQAPRGVGSGRIPCPLPENFSHFC